GGAVVESFQLFSRMMENPKYEKNLFADISAMTQLNRAGPNLVKTIERSEWHARLLNGSDYPLPGVMPIFSVDYLVSLKLGESHGPAYGGVVDGCPPGLELANQDIQKELDRRKPGASRHVTQRRESDAIEILSGVFEGRTTGTAIGFLVRNEDQRSKDYAAI